MYKMYKWTRELIRELVAEYRSYPVLYDASNPDYNNRVKRVYAFQKIVAALRYHGFKGSDEAVKRKLHTLRNQFIKEFRELEKSELNGEESSYEPKLWCFNQLSFLKPHCKRRQSLPNVSNENTTIDIDTDISSHCEDLKYGTDEMDQPPPKRLREKSIEEAPYRNSPEMEHVAVRKSNKSSSYTWLGRQVIFEMSNIQDETIRQDTSWAIQSILRDGIKKDRERRQRSASRASQNAFSSRYIEAKERKKRSYSPISDMSEMPMDDVFEDDRMCDILE